MKISVRSLVGVALALSLMPGSVAQAADAADKTGTVEIGAPFAWDGTRANGANVNYWNLTGRGNLGPFTTSTCTKDAQTYCDVILVAFSNPLTAAEIQSGKKSKTRNVNVLIKDYGPVPDPATDFDLIAFASDSTGFRGTELKRDGDATATAAETLTFPLETTIDEPTKYVRVEVVYWAVVDSSYKGTAKFL